MNLRRANDVQEIWAVMDNELFKRIAEDGVEPKDFKFSMDDGYFFIIEADNTDIGFWFLHHINNTTLEIHCNILEKYREHGPEAGRMIVRWFYNDSKYQKLNAEIPIIYPEVYHYTKKFGFQNEGINRQSIRKDGELVDQYRLGLTREEAKTSLEV